MSRPHPTRVIRRQLMAGEGGAPALLDAVAWDDGDARAVLDTKLRVRGIRNLRVIDASAMPFIPSGNTNAPTMALAHRAIDFIN